MNRRDAIRAGGAAFVFASAGCASYYQTTNSRAPPVLDDRPNSIYVPTHVEGMKMAGMGKTGRRKVGVMYSYPHRFWTVTGTDTKKVEIGRDDAIHLMAIVADVETGTVLPAGSGVRFKTTKDGETVDSRSSWPMLSQNMGFHFGDNIQLDGNGTYEVTVELGGIGLQRTGAFADAFDQSGSVSVNLEYDESERNDLPFRLLEGKQGSNGAVDPMEMMMPLSFAPKETEMPGRVIGTGESGDLLYVATGVQRNGRTYLAVSPRTRYNRFVLPMMSLSGTARRAGKTVFEGQLRASIDPELGYYYGAPIDKITGDETLSVRVDTPSQVSRHEGYETAFFDLQEATIDS